MNFLFQKLPILEYLWNTMFQLKYKFVKYESSQVIFLDDGQPIKIDIKQPRADYINIGKIICIIPGGLLNSSDSLYCKMLSYELSMRGYTILVINHRGVGLDYTNKKITLHSSIEHIKKTIDYINNSKIYASYDIYGIGISMGGHILASYMAEYDDFRGGMIFGNYFCTKNHLQNLESNYILKYNVLSDMNFLAKRFNYKKSSSVREGIEKYFFTTSETIKNWEEYYNSSIYPNKCKQLERKNILFINAENDPLTPLSFLNEIKKEFPSLNIMTTKNGYHIGWDTKFYLDTINKFPM